MFYLLIYGMYVVRTREMHWKWRYLRNKYGGIDKNMHNNKKKCWSKIVLLKALSLKFCPKIEKWNIK